MVERGKHMKRRFWYILGAVALLVLIFGSTIANFYTDWLWFGEVGYRSVFLKRIVSRIQLGLISGILFFAVVYLNLWLARRFAPPVSQRYDTNRVRARVGQFARRGFGWLIFLITLGVSFLVALETSSHWMSYQMFTHSTAFGSTDPIYHRDIGFYVFQLGFLKYIYGWLFFALIMAAIGTAIVHYIDRAIEFLAGTPTFAPHVKAHLSLLFAAVLFVKAWGYRLNSYDLLYSPHGFVYGAGYTDVHARLVALQILSVVAVIAGILALVNIYRRGITLPAAALIILIGASFIIGVIYPAIFQKLYVAPNQIARESRYITYNIQSTRKAFNLDTIDVRDFAALNNLTAQDIQRNRPTINSIRLWDYRPIQATYNQLQALGQYYEIENVDIDRYTVNTDLRQVMLAARELSPDAAEQAGVRTWVNTHFQYTHGFGAVMSPVNRATPEGLPEFFVSGIPPRSTVGIDINQPQIYFGEMTTNYVVVDSAEREFDYPAERQPVYTRYAGKGGIPVGSFGRKLAFAWRFSDTNLILSNPITSQSRMMFRREIDERVRTIFPFLMYDNDPYLVVSDGKLFWIRDAYTVSQRYPYSTPHAVVDGLDANYIRNSVKVVIDAYDGTVNFYIADTTDPMLKTYAKIFPGVFRPISQIPDGLMDHIRYPELLFRTQTEVLRRYHMQDPQVFFNQSDLWNIPNEITGITGEEVPIEPYYVVMRLPGEANEEFLIMRPFTPAKRNNMVAWMAAKCGPEDYGKIVLYQFPKDKLIYGPSQIETRINQDSVISAQLTLWDRSGSHVNRGNMLVIPIEQSILYVKPLYLESETSQIPELKRVIVVYGDELAMEPTLDAALARIFGGQAPSEQAQAPRPAAPGVRPGQAPSADVQRLINQAAQQFRRAQELQRQGDWAGYGEQQRALEQTLRQLQQASGR